MKTLFLLGLFLVTTAYSQSTGYTLSGTQLTSRSSVTFNLSGSQPATSGTTAPAISEVTTSTPTSIGYSAPTYNFATSVEPAAAVSTDTSIIQNAWTAQQPNSQSY
jgi:hypothetical protein